MNANIVFIWKFGRIKLKSSESNVLTLGTKIMLKRKSRN